MEPVRQYVARSDGMEYGDVYVASLQSAHEVNGWVGEAIDASAEAVEFFSRLRPSSQDEQWRTYGPYDAWNDADLSWAFRLSGDEENTAYEVWVGPRRSRSTDAMDLLIAGEVQVGEHQREGSFLIDFAAVENNPDLKRGPDVDRHYTGSIDVRFERDLRTDAKSVELVFDDFTVTTEVPVPEYFSADHYLFAREDDGSGEFHLSLSTTFQSQVWSGPAVDDLLLALSWNAEGAGRGHGSITGVDVAHDEVRIDECFDGDGSLLWRSINAPWDEYFPEYSLGERANCPDDALDVH
jgi:hypothetical protein